MKHRWRRGRKNRVRAEAIATTRRTLTNATSLKAGASKTVFNVGLYLLLLDQDLAEFTDDMVYAIGDARRRFIAKHEAMLLYEAAEDLPQLLGKEFRNAIKELGANPEQIRQVNEASSSVHRFFQEHREFLGEVRQVLAAHRDHDTLLYVHTLETLDPLAVMRVAAAFSEQLNRLTGLLAELAGLTVGVRAILDDMMRTSRQSAG